MELKDNLQHEHLSINKLIKIQDIKHGMLKLHKNKIPEPKKIKSETIPNQWREAIFIYIDKGGQGGQGKNTK